MNSQPKVIHTTSAEVKPLRIAAINLIESTANCRRQFGELMLQVKSKNLDPDRAEAETDMAYLSRTAMHLAGIEADLARSETVRKIQSEVDDLRTTPVSKVELDITRPQHRVSRWLKNLSNAIG